MSNDNLPAPQQATPTTVDTLRDIRAATCSACDGSGCTDHGVPDSIDGPGRPAVACASCKGTGWRNGVHVSDHQQATPERRSVKIRLRECPETGEVMQAAPEDMKVYDGIAAGYFADTQQATPERCKSCDDTGDVHDQTGEWRGVCNCPAGDAISAKATPEPVGEPEHHRQAWAALTEACQRFAKTGGSSADLTRAIDRFSDVLMGDTHPAPGVPEGFALVQSPITDKMHVAACKVLTRATGLDGLPQRMLDALTAAQKGGK